MAGRGSEADLMESMRLLWPAYFAEPAAAPPFPGMRFSVEAYAATFESLHAELPGLAARLAGVAVPTVFVHGAGQPDAGHGVDRHRAGDRRRGRDPGARRRGPLPVARAARGAPSRCWIASCGGRRARR